MGGFGSLVQPAQIAGHLSEVSSIGVVCLLTEKWKLPDSPSCQGTHQTWQEPLLAFFLILYCPLSQTSKTVSEVLGSNCTYLAALSSFKWRLPWMLERPALGMPSPWRQWFALRRIRPLCRTMFLNLLFVITLPHFIGFPPPSFSSLPWNINSTDRLYVCLCAVALWRTTNNCNG